jgi:hypothetical protein
MTTFMPLGITDLTPGERLLAAFEAPATGTQDTRPPVPLHRGGRRDP